MLLSNPPWRDTFYENKKKKKKKKLAAILLRIILERDFTKLRREYS